jgi:hypothetical protein
MATAFVVTPFLELRKSSQSSSYTMTTDWQQVYYEYSGISFLFGGANIDLTNMQAGDVTEVRVQYKLQSDGSAINEDVFTYNGVQPTNNKIAHVGVTSNLYGIYVHMRQTSGTLRSFYCEFYDAKRRGI